MMRDTVVLDAKAISVRLGKSRVLNEVTLSILRGTVTAIIGPNGSGKSTLLRTLARLLRPETGSVLLDGVAIAKMSPGHVARQIATLPQSPGAVPGMTVQELVEQGRYPHTGPLRMRSDRDRAAVERALELTSSSRFRHRLLDSLSGGERQRAWIALALAQEPRILLLDEPTTFLDVNHQIQALNLIQALNREHGLTVVMALHDLNQASQYAERLVVLDGGRIVEEGLPAEVIREDVLASVFNVQAHISVSPIDGALLCHPYAALPGEGDGADAGIKGPVS
ncbi:MAG: ABC transporter ATP-binding protein [Acidobacteriota bacterium]|nr:ABC transporter ATP-binding protein [Acidobacteriota bacterium]